MNASFFLFHLCVWKKESVRLSRFDDRGKYTFVKKMMINMLHSQAIHVKFDEGDCCSRRRRRESSPLAPSPRRTLVC